MNKLNKCLLWCLNPLTTGILEMQWHWQPTMAPVPWLRHPALAELCGPDFQALTSSGENTLQPSRAGSNRSCIQTSSSRGLWKATLLPTCLHRHTFVFSSHLSLFGPLAWLANPPDTFFKVTFKEFSFCRLLPVRPLTSPCLSSQNV